MTDSHHTDLDPWQGAAAFAQRLARALVGDATLAQDIAQEVMVQALRSGEPQPRGWLATVTRRMAGRALRDRRERPVREARACAAAESDHEQRTVERLQIQRRLVDAVAALPEPYRTVITMRHLDDLPPRAIARRQGQRPEAVRQQLHRGLEMLRARLDRDYGERRQWFAAFAATGLGVVVTPLSPLLLLLIAMKKVVVAVLAVLALGSWWLYSRAGGDPNSSPSAVAAVDAVHAAEAGTAPVADPVAVQGAPATTPARVGITFGLRVVDERQQPVAGCEVHCWREGATGAASDRTDDDGRVAFEPAAVAGRAVMMMPGRPPLLESLPALQGDFTFVLRQGQCVGGQVLVDGEAAPAGLRLGLSTAGFVLPDGCPETVAHLLRDYRGQCSTTTTDGGVFAFVGLAADWHGSLIVPRTHWLLPASGEVWNDDDRGRLSLSRTDARLVVRTTRLPTIAGRVVWDDDGSPVADAPLSVVAEFEDDVSTPMMGSSTDGEGHFVVGFSPASYAQRKMWCDPAQRPPFRSASVECRGVAGSEGAVTVELTADELPADDVEVRIPRAEVTHFRVTDPDGKPIAGARLGNRESEPTGSDGRGSFRGSGRRVLIGAPGCAVTAARPQAGTGTREDPLTYVLESRNDLVLRVVDAGGGAGEISHLLIESPGDLFAGGRTHATFDLEFGGDDASCGRMGKRRPEGGTEWTEWTCTVRPDDDGLVRLHSLEPGLHCTLFAVDSLQAKVASVVFVTPAYGKQATVELRLERRPRRILGRVQSESGAAIADAEVQLSVSTGPNPGDSRSTAVRTSADGSFEFRAIHSDRPVSLVVSAPGYVATELRDIPPAMDGEQHLFRLLTGRSVTVRVVDEAGQAVPLFASFAERKNGRQTAQRLGDGVCEWNDLPPQATFYVVMGGRRFEIVHDTTGSEAVLRVPTPARVRVSRPVDWPEPGDDDGYLGVELHDLDSHGDPVRVSLDPDAGESDLVLPGRYRIDLVMREWQGEPRRRVSRPLGPSTTVQLRAGELTEVRLER